MTLLKLFSKHRTTEAVDLILCFCRRCSVILSLNMYLVFLYKPCKVLDEGKMTCTSPSLEMSNVVNPVALHYGFVMDNVQSLLNISGSSLLRGTMLVYPDPTFEKFDSGVKQFFYSKNEHLVLNVSTCFSCMCKSL